MNDRNDRPRTVHTCTGGELVPGDVLLDADGLQHVVADSVPDGPEHLELTLRPPAGGAALRRRIRRFATVDVLMERVDPAQVTSAAPVPAGERRRRVVVTGVGAISPLGGDAASTWEGLLAGVCGARELDGEDFAELPVKVAAPAAIEPGEILPRSQARTMNRSTQFAVLAAREAWADAGLESAPESALESAPGSAGVDPGRAGVSVGTIIGGAPVMVDAHRSLTDKGARRVSPHTTPMLVPSASAAHIAIDLGARAEARTVVAACASGTEAIGQAIDRIRDGHVDVMIAGGTEAVITPEIMAGFASMRALSPAPDGPQHASRPFDTDRDGFVLGEGAGFLVLEDEQHALARGARIYCEAAGWGISADAHHMTTPDPDGTGITTAIRKALASARAETTDVIHINAHATATTAGDAAEAAALRTLFPAGTVPVTAPKGALGHLQGAAGGVEAVATALTLHHGLIPPTAGLEHPEENLGLDIVTGAPRPLPKTQAGVALSNSFGFGGHNAVLALRHHTT